MFKFLASNDKATLTSWPLKNAFFTFYKRDCAILKTLQLFRSNDFNELLETLE